MPSRRSLIGGGIAALAAPAVARAQGTDARHPIRWRMATSWPKNLVGPGVSAARLARRFHAMSEGRLALEVFGAGEIVPAFAVFDAVSAGTVDMGHTASFFVVGKIPAAAFFTTVPFGLDPAGHLSWLEAGGGRALWQELYAPFDVRPFLGGNTGPSVAGWFRKPIESLDDLKGLRIRVSGLGGELYRRLGAVPQAIPPGDVYPSLERGVIDAVELLGPMNDFDTGLWRIAPVCMVPGFNKPNGASETLVGRKAWEALPADLKAVVENACAAEHATALAESGVAHGEALKRLLQNNVRFAGVPKDVMTRARKVAGELIEEIGAGSAVARKIVDSYRATQIALRPWDRVSRVPAED